MAITIDRLDHLVLTVADIERTCDFYTSVLGFEVVTFAGGRKALAFGPAVLNADESHLRGIGGGAVEGWLGWPVVAESDLPHLVVNCVWTARWGWFWVARGVCC